MTANHRVTGKAVSIPVGLTIGLAVSVVVTLVFAATIAWLIGGERLSESTVGYGSLITLIISAGAGSIVAAAKIKHRRMFVCMMSGGLYYLFLLACTALFFGGQYNGMGVTAICVLAASASAGLLGLNRQGGHRRSRRRITTR